MGIIINHSQHLDPPNRWRLDHHWYLHQPYQHRHGLVRDCLGRAMHWVRLGHEGTKKHGESGIAF